VLCDAGSSFPTIMRIGTSDDEVWRVTDHGVEKLFYPTAVLRFSTFLPMRDTMFAGAGAAMAPHSIVPADIAAVRLVNWGDSTACPAEVWAIHASRRLDSPKVTAFINFICDYGAQ